MTNGLDRPVQPVCKFLAVAFGVFRQLFVGRGNITLVLGLHRHGGILSRGARGPSQSGRRPANSRGLTRGDGMRAPVREGTGARGADWWVS